MPIKRGSATKERDDDRPRGRRRDEDEDRYAYDDEDDEPRGRSRSRRDDDEDERDERPSRSRRSRDDDEDEDDRPRSRRSSRDEEDEDDRPRQRSRARDDDDDDDRGRGTDRGRSSRRRDDDDDADDRRPAERSRGRGRSREDDEDERPRGRVKRRSDRDDDRGDRRDREPSSAVRGGWDGASRTQSLSGDYADNFKMDADKEYVIKFVDDEPYASYRLHWLERSGKKSFVCPEDPDDPKSVRCPLCDAGDKTRAQYGFNIIDLTGGHKPEVKSWDVGVRMLNKLKKINSDPRNGPLSANYFLAVRTGKGTNSDTNISPIKERDLWDDYKVEELSEDELEDLAKKGYDRSIIDVPSKTQLRELADELTRYDDR